MNIGVDKLKYITSMEDTIEEAWTKIESNHLRTVIVLNEDKVVGTLTDGDIRRAIMKRRLLSTPIKDIMNVNFISITLDKRERAQQILKEHDIFLLPVVDEKLLLIDIYVKKIF